MPPRGLSNRDIEQLTLWPAEIPHSDLAAFFTLNVDDHRWLRSHRGIANQLGLAVQLCGLRYLGFIPADLIAAPTTVIDRLAEQLNTDVSVFADYCSQVKGRTGRDHLGWVLAHAGWSTCDRGDWKRLGDWLVERALEHDTPSVLFRQTLDYMRAERIVRPGLDRLMRAIGTARATADAELYDRIYLREETLRDANTAIINTHHRLPLAKAWGGGTLSSSDGLRIPMQGKSLTARALSRYFVDEGITTYTHVSDQHTTFGTQIIVSTDRDATYVLDELLGNTTELAIAEHSTDSHGQTLATFALFDLVGLRLSPRIAKLTQKPLWRPHPAKRYSTWDHAGPLLRHHAQIDVIDRHWDDLLRISGSLKRGNVSAALLLTRLQAGTRQHPLAKALLEYGKLIRTTHTLRWFTDEAFRRRVGRQLNRGEALNDLRHFISFAHGEKVRHRHHEDQTMQAHCLSLVTNACVLSTTTYLQDAIDAERAEGRAIHDVTIAHLSPARFEQINPYGQYRFDITEVRQRQRHPLRDP